MYRLTLALLAATLAFAPSATFAATAIWIGPENGDWSDPANWSTGAVPGSTDVVIIDDDSAQAAVVTASVGAQILTLQIDADDHLVVDTVTFRSQQAFLAGKLWLDSPTSFAISGFLHVEGSGQMSLDPGGGAEVVVFGVPGAFWNQGTINGAGELRPTSGLINDGIIEADSASNSLAIIPYQGAGSSLITNGGILRATNGAELQIGKLGFFNSQVITQLSDSGRIEAATASKVVIESSLIRGGMLSAVSDASGSGTVEVVNSTLHDVKLQGKITAKSATISGRIVNHGRLQVLERITVPNQVVELAGGGVMQLNNPTALFINSPILRFASTTGVTGTLRNTDHTIRGSGWVHLLNGSLDNRSVVETGFGDEEAPNNPSRTLQFEDGTIVNTGTFRAHSNHTLLMTDVDIENRSGVIEALPRGIVSLSNSKISGGILRAVAGDPESNTPGGQVQLHSPNISLSDIRLEGRIGSTISEAYLARKIEIDGVLQLKNLRLVESVEVLGGELELVGGAMATSSSLPSSARVTLTLTDSTLRANSIGSIGSRLQIQNRGTIVGSMNSSIAAQYGIVNAGLIYAEPGARLALPAVQGEPGHPDAELRADAGATILIPALSGGKVTSAAGTMGAPFSGTIVITGSGLESGLSNVTNNGLIHLQSSNASGFIENNGVIYTSGVLGQNSSSLQYDGVGELHLMGFSARPITPSLAAVLINGPNHTIRTHGTIDYAAASFINQGVVQADTGTLKINTSASGHFVQQGTLRTIGNSTLELLLSQQQVLNNDGVFDIGMDGTLLVATPLVNNRGDSDIHADGTLQLGMANLVNYEGATIRGGGRIWGAGTTSSNQSLLTNHGLVAPGSTVGDLQVRGNFVQSATGVLEIDVTGFAAGEFDQLLIETISATSGGLATLAGTLDFNFAPELIPVLGDELVVLTAKQITGVFDSIEGLPTLAEGLDWQIDYLPTMVMATVIGLTPPNLAGDFNGDGFVNLADYTVWRDGLGGDYTTEDYDLWKTNFGRSANDPAPEATSAASVPEPTTALLALALLPLLARRSRR